MPAENSAIFDYDRYEASAGEMARTYRSNRPFPHIVLDPFLEPGAALEAARAFPTDEDQHWTRYRHVNENKANTDRWEDFPPEIAAIVREMNSPRFVELLSKVTGIEGLKADPDIEGGGMHQSWHGGFLNVHTDFTMHRKNPTWRRRCNLILYMNENWDPAWGGALELWDSRMKDQMLSVPCLLNRAVLFNTPKSLHGFPDPLTCPDGQSRKSVQWYYYTTDETAAPEATTYYPRPQDPPAKRVMIVLDNLALRAYAWMKRKLGVSDSLVSRIMRMLSSR